MTKKIFGTQPEDVSKELRKIKKETAIAAKKIVRPAPGLTKSKAPSKKGAKDSDHYTQEEKAALESILSSSP